MPQAERQSVALRTWTPSNASTAGVTVSQTSTKRSGNQLKLRWVFQVAACLIYAGCFRKDTRSERTDLVALAVMTVDTANNAARAWGPGYNTGPLFVDIGSIVRVLREIDPSTDSAGLALRMLKRFRTGFAREGTVCDSTSLGSCWMLDRAVYVSFDGLVRAGAGYEAMVTTHVTSGQPVDSLVLFQACPVQWEFGIEKQETGWVVPRRGLMLQC
jgi:hypothetical protein